MVLAAIGMVVGLAILGWGADAFVRGASGLALLGGVPPLVIGLTIVAIGTSTPELLVSLMAVIDGSADLALGNVVGSNIGNILLILGLCAVVRPLHVATELLRFDLPVMVVSALAAGLAVYDGFLTHLDGLLLLVGLGLYVARHVRVAMRQEQGVTLPVEEVEAVVPTLSRPQLAVALLGGLAGLVIGSHLLVDGAVELAVGWGVSELLIGLTVVAVGTSLPELATSMAATLRGERDLAVGNVVGSNIFNILLVLGGASFLGPGDILVAPTARTFDVPVMIGVTVLAAPILLTGRQITRGEGVVLLALYAGYVLWIASHSG